MSNNTEAVKKHYSPNNLSTRIEEVLQKMGKTRGTLTLDDLTYFDELHVRGAVATSELVQMLDPSPDMHVLDVGAGLGGPARRLARAIGCRVTGVDLSKEYTNAGTLLNEWLQLDEQVSLIPGDATDLSQFDTATFDAAWTIHATMNITNRDALYAEVARVLKPDAKFVSYDIFSLDQQDIHFPVPWAQDASMSFLVTLNQLEAYLEKAGFTIIETRDHSVEGLAAMQQAIERMGQTQGAPSLLGPQLIFGADFPAMAKSVTQNLAEKRISVNAVICRRIA